MECRQSFESLPLELVGRILGFLGPRDVVQLRLVSKLFRDVTYDPVIWKTIYASARLPRPSGPFPSQSTHFLEHTLRRSERLAECWTTQPIQVISSRWMRLRGSLLGHPRIIGGKWLLTFESYRQIVFHDVDTHARQVLCEDTGLVVSWDACSVMSPDGLLVYVVFRKNTTSSEFWRAPWKLQEFQVHGESSYLSHSASLDVPVRYPGQSVCLVADKSPFLYIMGQHLIFDTRSRTFYEFPQFASELDGIHTHLFSMIPHRVLLTSSYIVAIFTRPQELAIPSSTMESTLIQAFTLPAAPHQADETGILCLSHEGILPDHLANLVLARNSIIDPITESTSLRFLRLQPQGNRLCFSCVDLTLAKCLSDVILPLPIDVHNIFAVESGMYDPFISPCGFYIEASDDGHVRGFCKNRVDADNLANSPLITRFTVDATGDRCIAMVGPALRPRWIDGEDLSCFSTLSFDGVIGRFCYLKGGQDWRLHGFADVAIVDVI